MRLGPTIDIHEILIRNMTAAQLLARAELPIDTDEELEENQGAVNLFAFLKRAAVLANDTDASLALLFDVLSEEPPEVAAGWSDRVEEMAARLHPDTDHPTLARAVARALAQWKDV